MNNGDMPAMAQSCTADGHANNVEQGLTKREYFAATITPPFEALKEALKEHNSAGFSIDDYIEVSVAYRIKEANVLLKELENESN